MKKVNLIAVGKLKEKFWVDAASEYTKRLSRFCDLKIIQLSDFDKDGIKKESDLILQNVKDFWLLDIHGESLLSKDFALLLDKEFLKSEVTLVIGGSDGVDERVKKAAAKRISFGLLTYPHQLMRVMVLEQLYRAFTICEGLPYHK